MGASLSSSKAPPRRRSSTAAAKPALAPGPPGSTAPSTAAAWGWSGPAGDHSPFPPDVVVPYRGAELLYAFIDIIPKYQIMSKS